MRRAFATLALPLSALVFSVVGCLGPAKAPPALDAVDAPAAEPASFGNVPFWTLGGKQWWADELWEGGWRIQRSLVSGHHRLLDTGDVRRGWGNFEGCLDTLARHREAGEVEPFAEHVVVLLPGIWRSKDSMEGLAEGLERAGYQVAALNYPSTRWSLEDNARQVDRVLERFPPEVKRLSFVTHSMGGLVARQLLGAPVAAAATDGATAPDETIAPADTASWRARVTVDRLVMIFPPNQGSVLADRWQDNLLYRGLYGPSGQQLTTDVAAALPVPAVPTGIIAGGRGDGEGHSRSVPGDDDDTVAVAETALAGAELLVLDVEHTRGMNDERTIDAVLRFLANGRF